MRNKANFPTGEYNSTRTYGLPNWAISSPSYSPIGYPRGQKSPKIAKKSPKNRPNCPNGNENRRKSRLITLFVFNSIFRECPEPTDHTRQHIRWVPHHPVRGRKTTRHGNTNEHHHDSVIYVCIPLLRQPALASSNFNLGRAVLRHPRGGMAAFTTKSTNQVSFKSQNNYCHTLTR